jgi:hypothetical protein
MDAELLRHVLLRAAALASVSAASLAVYLVALRFVAWDLVPAAALPHARWWQRHARQCLLGCLVIAVLALGGLLLVP